MRRWEDRSRGDSAPSCNVCDAPPFGGGSSGSPTYTYG